MKYLCEKEGHLIFDTAITKCPQCAASPAPQPEPTPQIVQAHCKHGNNMCIRCFAEQPSPPAGARDVEQFIDDWLKKHNYHEWMCGNTHDLSVKQAAQVCLEWAKKERERADAAERELSKFEDGVNELGEDYERKIESLRTELREAKEALGNLVNRLKVVHDSPEYRNVWVFNQLRNGEYTGPKYDKELIEAKALLSRKGEGSSRVVDGGRHMNVKR